MNNYQINNNIVTIFLNNNYQTIIDVEFLNEVIGKHWYILNNKKKPIVVSSEKRTLIYLHRFIYQLAHPTIQDIQITHIGDSLNNTRANLTTITNQNKQKNVKPNCRNTSGYKGVYFHKKAKKWACYIHLKKTNKNVHIGLFDNKHTAAWVFDDKAIELGQNEYLNFL